MYRSLPLFALLLAGLAGCSRQTGEVTGTVTLDDRPLAAGTVILLAEDNKTYPAPVGKDGKYAVRAVPYGKVRVAVVGEEARVAPRPEPRKDVPAKDLDEARADDDAKRSRMEPKLVTTGVALPAIYAEPAKSGLAFEMDAPAKEFPIGLKKSP